MRHVAARVAACAVMTAVAMVLFSAIAVYAKSDPDNPNGSHDGLLNNPGHHYGQLKHQSPPATPPPVATPLQIPVAPLLSNALHPATASQPSAVTGPQLSPRIPHLRLTFRILPAEEFTLADQQPAIDGLWWLLLLILPLLLAIWVLVATRLAATGVRRLRAGRPTAAMAAATA